jgi:endonuclease/exonuclease/phosphatase family metal-dependent hydrolase
MTYNILEGGTGRIDPLAEVIRLSGTDVVVVQEALGEDGEKGFHKLADRVGMDRFLAENPRTGQAVGILSRLGVKEVVNHAAMDGRFSRGCLHVIVEKPGARSQKPEDGGDEMREHLRHGSEYRPVAPGPEDLVVIGVHLPPGELVENEEKRLSELAALFDVAKLFQGREHVIAGDFNASHPSQKIELAKVRAKTRERVMSQGGIFPREVVRQMLEHGYADAHALHHGASEFGTSFTTAHPAMRVDYVFVTAGLMPFVRGCEVFRPEMGRFASDHYPVVCEIGST